MEHEEVKQLLVEVAEVFKKHGFSPDKRTLCFRVDSPVLITDGHYRFPVQDVTVTFENCILTERQYLGAKGVCVGIKEQSDGVTKI